MGAPITVIKSAIPDVLIVESSLFRDDRGHFVEAYCESVWDKAGLEHHFVQDNLSSSRQGTLRGMHYQIRPHALGKLVRALSGSVYDVAVDMREGSPHFGQWVGEELTAENGHALWVPEGFAHGFIALSDDTVVLYKCTAEYAPDSERSLHYADPRVGIEWPIEPKFVAEKDEAAPILSEAEFSFVYGE